MKAETDLMAQAIAGFEYLWQRSHRLGGQPAMIVAAKTDGPNGPMEQRLIFCLSDKYGALTMTATASPVFSPEQLAWLNGFASSFTFRA